MFSEFKSLSFMGVSNSEMFLSEKDLDSMEFDFLVRPALEFEDECDVNIESSQDEDDDDDDDELHQKKKKVQEQDQEEEEEEEKGDDKYNFLVSTLEIKLPSLGEFKIEEEEEDDNDGFKTPTSLDQKIPAVILQCPPAPRKPKSLPSTKRKSPCQSILLDLSNEIESLFSPALVADLGGKNKKVRQGNDTK